MHNDEGQRQADSVAGRRSGGADCCALYPLVGSNCLAGQAYENICHRILGEEVAFLDLDAKQGVFSKLKDLFKKN